MSKDINSTPIEIGDVVACAITNSYRRGCSLSVGTVTRISEDSISILQAVGTKRVCKKTARKALIIKKRN